MLRAALQVRSVEGLLAVGLVSALLVVNAPQMDAQVTTRAPAPTTQIIGRDVVASDPVKIELATLRARIDALEAELASLRGLYSKHYHKIPVPKLTWRDVTNFKMDIAANKQDMWIPTTYSKEYPNFMTSDPPWKW